MGAQPDNKKLVKIVLSLIGLLLISCMVLTDYFLLTADFNNCLHLLATARDAAVRNRQTFFVRFVNKRITIENPGTGAVFGSLDVLTLKRANFETPLGEETEILVNKRAPATIGSTHDLDIILKSLLGFKKHIRIVSKQPGRRSVVEPVAD